MKGKSLMKITDKPHNRLIHEKSPYLLQHAYNPVDWYPWCNEAFKKAKAEDAYFGDIRTPIPGTSGQHNGIIRTAFRWHTDILSSL